MSIQAYSTTPGSNTAISGIDISEGCAPSGINNAIRQFMADVKSAYSTVSKTGAYTVTTDDFGKLIRADASGGAFTITLPAAATAGDGFQVAVINTGASGTVTIDGNSAETINDAATYALSSQYQCAVLRCDGSEWWLTNNNEIDINGLTEETSVSPADEIVIYDGSAGTNRKMTRKNFLAITNEYRLYGAPQVVTSTGAGTYNPSSTAVRLIEVILVGAGGGAAAAPGTGAGERSTVGGGGGGAGIRFSLPINGATYSASYSVGAGSAGGGGGSTTWNDGTVNVAAGGGNQSSSATSSGDTFAQRGEEGQATLTTTTGATIIASINGADGEDGIITGNGAKAGYGGASAFGMGTPRGGGVTIGGGGSQGGSDGHNYGAGAAGAAIAPSDGGGGAAKPGGPGIIIVYEYV